MLPDGTPAWLDGGPPRFTQPIAGVPVLHRVAIEHGSLRPPSPARRIADLGPEQLAAVLHPTGTARIVAPAGSGKTRVLTERARHLVRDWGVPTGAMTLVAFNKRAQTEIVQRTADLPGLQVRTLNALGLAILQGDSPFARSPQRLTTITEPDVRRLLAGLVALPRRRNADPLAPWLEALSAARLGLVDPAEVDARYDGEVTGFADVFPRYRAALASRRQVDFDEQVFLAIERLLADPELRASAQRTCRVMLVDEFQDLTPAHLLMVRLLAGPDGAVFGVGDDDQTIYGYNGASPEWLIDFSQIFPGAGEHLLHVNHRCPAGVVEAADRLLRHNRRRVDKTIVPARAGTDGSDNGYEVSEVGDDTVATTVAAVRRLLDTGRAPSDIAVLTRVNSLLAPVHIALAEHGIPVDGGVGPDFVERTAVRSTLAWLRLARGTALRSDDIAEALRRPSRPLSPALTRLVVGKASTAELRALARWTNDGLGAAAIASFADDVDRLAGMVADGATTAQVVEEVLDGIGVAGAVAGLDRQRRGMNRAAQGDDLTAVAQLARLHDDPVGFGPWLAARCALPHSTDGVALSTIHRVKGLEWPVVVVHHADDDQFPHRLADDVEEERRLFHVAITRSRDLTIVVPTTSPTSFITECRTAPRVPPAESSPTIATTSVMTKRSARRDTTAGPSQPVDEQLFQALRKWRRTAADGKPAFTIFSDATLQEIARARPTTLAQLAALKGVGPAKLAAHGEALLGVVERHC